MKLQVYFSDPIDRFLFSCFEHKLLELSNIRHTFFRKQDFNISCHVAFAVNVS